MHKSFLYIFLFAVTCQHGLAQNNNKDFCDKLNAIITSLNSKGDWLTTLKGNKTQSEYFLGFNYNCKVTLPGSLCGFIHKRRDQSLNDSGNYYYSAILLSEKKWSPGIETAFEKIKANLRACIPGYRIAEDSSDKYALNDAYYSRRNGTTIVEVSRYFNSNSNTWVILLSVELQNEDADF